jgi:outer membrane protein OmpA-like peptidoglycan-associated protein
MRTAIIATVTAVSVLLSVPATAAEKSHRNQNIGVSSGAVIGAIAAGPIGAIVGATIGAKVGDEFDNKNVEIASLESDVDRSNSKVARIERDMDKLGSELDRLNDLARPELLDLMQAGIEMDLLFRTDEAVVADTTGVRLATLAGTLARMDDVRIQLDGFADERGDESYNKSLSERRVQFIRDQFVAAGVHPGRISTTAHGESVAQDDSPDSFALERRVSVRLFIDDSPSLAANPN